MSKRFKLACVQVNSRDDMAANITTTSDWVRRARDAGAELIGTPEVTNLMAPESAATVAMVKTPEDDPSLAAFRDLARETGAWLLIGSLAVRPEGWEKIANRSYLLDPGGETVAWYDKIHMFDINLPDGREYRESRVYAPGEAARLVETPWGTMGMTICYDIRFPHLYRGLAQAGAEFVAIPAAFTRVTGQAHWHVLQRARAIENGCFVFAPAQCGEHPGNRQTYGHSLIIDPWGEVLADAGEEPGFAIAEIDLARVAEVRGRIPSLTHDRAYAQVDAGDRAAAE